MSGSPPPRAFICYRRSDSAHVAGRLYDRLAARWGDHRVFMDVDSISLGADWRDAIANAIRNCRVVIALIGRQWLGGGYGQSASRLDDPNDVVRMELEAALEEGVPIIPVLVNGVPFPRVEELPASLEGLTRKQALRLEHDSFQTDVRRLLEAVAKELGDSVARASQSTASPTSPEHEHQRARLLNRLQQSYSTFLLQSLTSTIRLELGLVQVSADNFGAITPVVPVHPSRRTLPRGTSLVEVFRSVGGMDSDGLLVLGAPGAGKTTLLIEMAHELTKEAIAKSANPIPVFIPLSAWGANRPHLSQWLEEQLLSLYKVPRSLGQKWLNNRRLLLLFDGLDEVGDLDARRTCLEEIETLGRAKDLSVILSSRLADYRSLRAQTRFSTTVEVLPCDPSDVLEQMRQAGSHMRNVVSVVENNRILLSFLSTPFFISVLSLTYTGNPEAGMGDAQGDWEQQRDHLISNLIGRRLELESAKGPERRRPGRDYSPERTLHWLSTLARQLSIRGETVFQLEHLQVSWLASAYDKRLVAASPKLAFGIVLGIAIFFSVRALADITGVPTSPVFHLVAWIAFGAVAGSVGKHRLSRRLAAWGAFGTVSGLVFATIVWNYGLWGMFVDPLYFAALFGLVGEMLVWFVKEELAPVEFLSWSWRRARQGFFRRLWIGSTVGILYGLLFGVSTYVPQGWFNIRTSVVFGVAMFGPIFGILWAAGMGLVTGLSSGPIPIRITPNEGIRRSARNGVATGLAMFLTASIIVVAGLFLIEALYAVAAGPLVSHRASSVLSIITIGLDCGLGFGLLWGLASGLGAVVQNTALRLLLWHHRIAPMRYVRWLEYVVRLRIMYRVGGGYVFMHRMVQEYFVAH